MFANGPMPGRTPKQDALALLPPGTRCRRMTAMGITGSVVQLPSGQSIGSAGNSGGAWENALAWALRNPEQAQAAREAASAPAPARRAPGR